VDETSRIQFGRAVRNRIHHQRPIPKRDRRRRAAAARRRAKPRRRAKTIEERLVDPSDLSHLSDPVARAALRERAVAIIADLDAEWARPARHGTV
jgi:hypothetical protein